MLMMRVPNVDWRQVAIVAMWHTVFQRAHPSIPLSAANLQGFVIGPIVITQLVRLSGRPVGGFRTLMAGLVSPTYVVTQPWGTSDTDPSPCRVMHPETDACLQALLPNFVRAARLLFVMYLKIFTVQMLFGGRYSVRRVGRVIRDAFWSALALTANIQAYRATTCFLTRACGVRWRYWIQQYLACVPAACILPRLVPRGRLHQINSFMFYVGMASWTPTRYAPWCAVVTGLLHRSNPAAAAGPVLAGLVTSINKPSRS
ncbi:Transmembrane protein 135 N-terminal domain-containing protein [Plasmodiophora brassicae]|uniref:Transmembrane protein 135 N-terminal domain-containing protein n=1 Tax=Plasmodiophora brassicae TaxID=37360 RepID=A0A0G4J3X4_PLABS|nr:hypothetical protein PBRA_008912 [Plasmodiophora brassicae]